MTSTQALSKGQAIILTAATVPMIGFGALGGWGTYTNITSVFHRSATALGVVAAGEGATLVLALVLVGLTMLGQSSPAAVRFALWALPTSASATGAAVAGTLTEAVVFAVTPLAMCVSAEGMGLLARRIVVHRTGVDADVQRRNAETVQLLAYHRARSENHPSSRARKRSERAAWRLAKRVGVGDAYLGTQLVDVQRIRLTEGADAALSGMLSLSSGQQDTVPVPVLDTETVPLSLDTETVPLSLSSGQDTEITPVPVPVLDSPPVPVPVPRALDMSGRLTYRAFAAGVLSESPELSVAELMTRIRAEYGDAPTDANLRKAIQRARGDVSRVV